MPTSNLSLALLQNLGGLAILVVLWTVLARQVHRLPDMPRQLVLGGFFAASMLFGMSIPYQLPNSGLLLDCRGAVLAVSALFGGPVATALAAAVAIVYRLSLGGQNAIGAISIGLAAVFCTLIAVWLRRRHAKTTVMDLLWVGLVPPAVWLTMILAINPYAIAVPMTWLPTLGSLVGVNLLATMVLGVLLLTDERRTQLEADLARARDAADIASRGKSAFLATMSHELRTPLNAVIGFAELIERETLGPAGNRQYVAYAADIRGSGEHLLALINDILDFSKAEADRLELQEEPFEMKTMLLGALRMIEPKAAECGLSLELQIEGVEILNGDSRRLRQVLLNLLSNAVKFTPSGGSIRVLVWRAEDGDVRIQVIDTGIGIAVADRPKLFEPFGQVDHAMNRRAAGTGLGLPLARRLVELHGGGLDIDSEPGKGTTVHVRLPAARVV